MPRETKYQSCAKETGKETEKPKKSGKITDIKSEDALGSVQRAHEKAGLTEKPKKTRKSTKTVQESEEIQKDSLENAKNKEPVLEFAGTKKDEILVTDEIVKKEKRRLLKIFESAIKEEDEHGKKVLTGKGAMLSSLIDEAAFVRAVLLEARRLIKLGGIETTTVNGSQKYKNATPATKIYAEYLRTYTPLINSLLEHIPEKKEKKQSRLAALAGV